MTYPGVLSHRCLIRGEADPADIPTPEENADAIVYVSNKRSHRLSWSSHTLRIIPRYAEIAEEIVIAAGKNPKTTSAVEMDQLMLYFFCMDCATLEVVDGIKRACGKVWKWRLAVGYPHLEIEDQSDSVCSSDIFCESTILPARHTGVSLPPAKSSILA